MVAHKDRGGGNAGLLGFNPDASLFRIQPWRALTTVVADWCLIAAAFTSAILWPHPMTYLAAAVIVARTQLALAVVMHESAHGTLLPSQWMNDAVGQACAAGPLCLSLKTYRAGHLQHHLQPMCSDDPVAVVFDIIDYPISRRRLLLRLLGALLGIAYLVSAFKFIRGDYRGIMPAVPKSRSDKVWEIGTMVTSNGMILGLLALCGHAWLYLVLWTLPSVTLLPLFGRIRAIMEHAGLTECDDQSRNARTIIYASWQTFLFGPHAIHYHIEHHLFVRMPFYNLSKVHRRLHADGLLPAANLYGGYGGVLRDVSVPASR